MVEGTQGSMEDRERQPFQSGELPGGSRFYALKTYRNLLREREGEEGRTLYMYSKERE